MKNHCLLQDSGLVDLVFTLGYIGVIQLNKGAVHTTTLNNTESAGVVVRQSVDNYLRIKMNEKIKELALQAGGSHYPDVGGKTLEKFAELIIRECAAQVDNVYKQGGGTYGETILRHFGIKS